MAKKSKKTVAQAMDVKMPEFKPRLTVNVEQIPEIKDWSVGEEYDLNIRGKMVAVRDGEFDEDSPMEATFIVENAKTDNYED